MSAAELERLRAIALVDIELARAALRGMQDPVMACMHAKMCIVRAMGVADRVISVRESEPEVSNAAE